MVPFHSSRRCFLRSGLCTQIMALLYQKMVFGDEFSPQHGSMVAWLVFFPKFVSGNGSSSWRICAHSLQTGVDAHMAEHSMQRTIPSLLFLMTFLM